LENGYAIWDFRGQELEKHIVDRFKQFLWRPRPPTLLDKEQRRQIRKNLREYSRQFEEEDAAIESNVSAELVAHRKRLVDEWNAWRKRCREEAASMGGRVDRRNSREEEEGTEEIEVWIEELIEEVEELVVDE
jgi:translation initiation factor 3 subunit B